VEWRYEKDGIRLRLVGDPKLNFFQGSATTLMICVYTLKDPNAFNQMGEEKEGMTKLLECGRFDPSVTGTKRIVIQPGQEVNEAMDRAEGAKYVALVAGYYSLQKEKAVRLIPVPVLLEVKGLIFRDKTHIPAILNIDLYLGPQAIQEPKGK
jgi:type VI secretion system VasD/TssJ family lipoprotein